jgi:hypothetical protein
MPLDDIIQNIEFNSNIQTLQLIVKEMTKFRDVSADVQKVMNRTAGKNIFDDLQRQNKGIAESGRLIVEQMKERQRLQAALSKGAIGDVSQVLGNGGWNGLGIRSLDQELKNAKKSADAASKSLTRFHMEFLGIMFAGQALQRTFGGLFKDLLKTWNDLTVGSNPLKNALIDVQTQFTYLKYSIVEAMSGPLTAASEMLSGLMESLINADPGTLEAIGISVGAIAAAGAALFVAGQGALAVSSIFMFLENVRLGKYSSELSALNGKLNDLAGGNFWGKTFAIGFAIDSGIDAVKEFKAGDTYKAIQDSLLAAGFSRVVLGDDKNRNRDVGYIAMAYVGVAAVDSISGMVKGDDWKSAVTSMQDALANAFILIGTLTFPAGGVWLLTAGLVLKFKSITAMLPDDAPNTWNEAMDNIASGFGNTIPGNFMRNLFLDMKIGAADMKPSLDMATLSVQGLSTQTTSLMDSAPKAGVSLGNLGKDFYNLKDGIVQTSNNMNYMSQGASVMVQKASVTTALSLGTEQRSVDSLSKSYWNLAAAKSVAASTSASSGYGMNGQGQLSTYNGVNTYAGAPLNLASTNPKSVKS